MRKLAIWGAAAWLLTSSIAVSVASSETARDARLRHGEYLYKAAGCLTCHTRDAKDAKPLAGGRRLETDFGVFYSPNITPDRETGIGGWSDADFIRALRDGVGRDGQQLYPAFPYTSYTHMSDDDMLALKAYLFSRPAITQANKPHELPWYLRFRPAVRAWKFLYFTPGPFQPRPDQTPKWNRGAYLVTAVTHCGECHTPRDRLGGMQKKRQFSGNRNGPEGSAIPNITPDKRTGIGRWSDSELSYYLEAGMNPDGDFAGDLMADVIDQSTKYLTNADRAAIANFILSLPAIESAPRPPNEKVKKKKNGKSEF
jgi:mono/diheme cytochrome c family protein